MKAKCFSLFILTAMCAMTMTMTSCTSDNLDNPVPPPEAEPLADVTVLFYGHGGGLHLNQQEPSLWCPSRFGYNLPDGNFSDDLFT